MIIGVVSDTHGLLRPEALTHLHGSELILHAGDVGREDILPRLKDIAPTLAVRGNIDLEPWTCSLKETLHLEVETHGLYMIHNLDHLDLDPAAADISVVISGHTHAPKAVTRGGVLYLNPGSIGPRRFRLPISMARLEVGRDGISHQFIEWKGDETG